MDEIRKAAVIGAGVMGSGIAAHLANAGVEVTLLDMEAATAAAAVARQLKAGGFMRRDFAARIATGSITADLGRLSEADWIIEAIAERPDAKRDLYRRIEAVRREGSVVSSNTSTIQLSALMDGMPERLAVDFLITHFFNPPRAMRLMELVPGRRTRPGVVERIRDFADLRLGKSVVLCKDTPGFIANRIGNFWMAAAVNEAIRLGIDIELADAAISRPFGIPKTGIFALGDLVGVDVIALVWRSLHAALPPTDALRAYPEVPDVVAGLVSEGRLGRKSDAGFYRLSKDRVSREALDLATGAYRPERRAELAPALAADPRLLMTQGGDAGRYAAAVMGKTLAYAAAVKAEIADGPDAVDTAMRTGYGWDHGPFQLIDQLGAGWLAESLADQGIAVPPYLAQAAAAADGFYIGAASQCLLPDGGRRAVARSPGLITIAGLWAERDPVETWESASLWDMGDSVACFEIRSKMNTISPAVLMALEAALGRTARDFRALVIGSGADIFSAGADLHGFLAAVEAGPDAVAAQVDLGQRVYAAVRSAPFPVVGAAGGLALGGGCELLLHCSAIQAHAELSIGLIETRVGLIPGWGGCRELLRRFASEVPGRRGPVAPAIAAFNLIAPAWVSKSAFEAQAVGFLRRTDGITMNRDRLLADAKVRALALVDAYVSPVPGEIVLSGSAGHGALVNAIAGEVLAGRVKPDDSVVLEALASVLTGGDRCPLRSVEEQEVLSLERATATSLLGTGGTVDRIRNVLAGRGAA